MAGGVTERMVDGILVVCKGTDPKSPASSICGFWGPLQNAKNYYVVENVGFIRYMMGYVGIAALGATYSFTGLFVRPKP